MILKQLNIKNFRNYDDASISLSDGINIFYGNNAQGKTNLLESIYFLSFTKSHRSFIDSNLIKNGEKFLRISGVLKKNELFDTKLEITLEKDKKNIFVDGDNYKKVSDYITKMNIVIFYPEDLEIIKGAPSVRRRYLNSEISQYDSNYLVSLNNFRKIQKMRNDYLKRGSLYIDESYLKVLNDYFIDCSLEIYKARSNFIFELNQLIESIFFDLTGMHGFRIEYENNFNVQNFLEYEGNIKEDFSIKLDHCFDSELRQGCSLVGPHKDDFSFYLDEMNLRNYGSQGQQRLSILSLKLAEVILLNKYNNDTPILLLDDVFSELDDEKKNKLLKYINQDIQTIITTTDLKNIDDSIIKNSKLFKINDGIIEIEEVEEDGK